MSTPAYQRFLRLQVQDKVGFMINNLTRDNLDGKADELKKALKPELWPWFCNYMVIRRVAQEANHQNLYMQVTICTAHECTMGSLQPPDATAVKRFVVPCPSKSICKTIVMLQYIPTDTQQEIIGLGGIFGSRCLALWCKEALEAALSSIWLRYSAVIL